GGRGSGLGEEPPAGPPRVAAPAGLTEERLHVAVTGEDPKLGARVAVDRVGLAQLPVEDVGISPKVPRHGGVEWRGRHAHEVASSPKKACSSRRRAGAGGPAGCPAEVARPAGVPPQA